MNAYSDPVARQEERFTRNVLSDLRLHGDQTSKQLAKALGMLEGDVRTTLIRAEIAGAVRRVGRFWRIVL